MPQQYIYEILISDGNIEEVLKSIDQRIQGIGQTTQRAFQNVERQMGQGIKRGAEQAKRAMTDEEKAAQRLEKSLVRLFAAELKLAAGADDAAQEILKQAAAGAQSADALQESISLSGTLSERQIAYARAIAETKARITELTGALTQEGADHQALSAALAEEQARLVAINAAKEQAAAASQEAAEAVRQELEATKRSAAEKKAVEAADKRVVAQKKRLQNEVTRLIKTYPQERAAIARLVQEHGSFNVQLGKTDRQLSEVQREFLRIIRANPQLRAEIKKLTGEFENLDLTVDRPGFLSSFGGGNIAGIRPDDIRRAGFALERFGVQGAAAFGEIVSVAGLAGVAIGGTLVAVTSLQRALSAMARIGIQAFKDLINSSVEAAAQLDTTRAVFNAIFEQDARAAEVVLDRILDLSNRLGEDVGGLARVFLPEVEDLDQLERIVEIGVALARFQPEQGIQGATLALQEFIQEGNVRALAQRFEISRTTANRIRDVFETEGMTAGLEALSGELERLGRSIDDLSGTWEVAVGRMEQRAQRLGEILGEPIIDELMEQLENLSDFIDRNDAQLESLARGIGEIVGESAAFAGEELLAFLEDLDPQQLLRIAEGLGSIARSGIQAISDTVGNLDPDKVEEVVQTLDHVLEVSNALVAVTGPLVDAQQSITKILSPMAALNDELGFTGDILRGLVPEIELLNGFVGQAAREWDQLRAAIAGANALLEEAPGSFINALAGVAQGQSPEEIISNFVNQNLGTALNVYNDELERLSDETENATRRQEEFGEATEESTEAAEAQAEAMLALRQAQELLATAQERVVELTQKINEAREEFAIDINRRLADIQKDYNRDIIALELELSRKREDIAKDTRDKLEDIRTKYDQDLRDAGIDLDRDEEDAEIKHQRRMLDQEIDFQRKRIDLERDFRRKLDDIRDKADFNAFEAALQNDALEIRRIRRREQFELEQARKDRDEEEDDLGLDEGRQRQDLQRQYDREREDAQLANERKIEDLKRHLDDRIRLLFTELERERRDLLDWEERKRQDIDNKLDERVQDFQEYVRQKQEDLNRSLRDEYTAIIDAQGDIIMAEAQIIQQRLHMWQNFYSQRAQFAGGVGNTAFGGPLDTEGSGAQPGPTMVQLRRAARDALRNSTQQLSQAEFNNTMLLIDNMSRQELISLIQQHGGVVPRQFGGPVYPDYSGNRAYLVGEQGPELFVPGSPGNIVPHDVLRQMFYSMPSRMGGGRTSIDRSSHLNLEVPYRPGLSDIERKEIEIIAAGVVRRSSKRGIA